MRLAPIHRVWLLRATGLLSLVAAAFLFDAGHSLIGTPLAVLSVLGLLGQSFVRCAFCGCQFLFNVPRSLFDPKRCPHCDADLHRRA